MGEPINSQFAYEALNEKIDRLLEIVGRRLNQPLSDKWIENADAAKLLAVSKRWMQNRRTNGDITYSKIEGRIYYRASDLQKLLEDNIVKSKQSRNEN